MARIKPTIWSISDEVAQLQSVNIFGEIHDIHGCFSICHTYMTRKEKLNKPAPVLDFNFYIYDSGLVTGFKGVFCVYSLFACELALSNCFILLINILFVAFRFV
jgi:hypothetical protein